MAEGNVAIAPDNVLAGAHNIRTVTVTPLSAVVAGQSEEQQVITLADASGNLFSINRNSLPVVSDELANLLQGIIRRLDILNTYAASPLKYTPPDDLYN